MNDVVLHQQGTALMPIMEMVQQAQAIQQLLGAVMKKGTHYDVIPGTKQNTLLKPGAEKILSMFRIGIKPTIEDLSDGDIIRYRVSLEGFYMPTGSVVGYGVGECSTGEEKYKWRAAVCDEEYDVTPADRRRIKWASKWGDRRGERVVNQVKQVRTDSADLANTVLKMAKKRAMSDLCLTATAASDVFAQDLEDLDTTLREHLAGQERVNDTGTASDGSTTQGTPARSDSQRAAAKPPLDAESFKALMTKWAPIVGGGKQTPEQAIAAISTRNSLTEPQKQAIRDIPSNHQAEPIATQAASTMDNSDWVNGYSEAERGQA